MTNKEIERNLIKLANDLYSEGYACGISGIDSDRWFSAWALAMKKVAAGTKYHDGLIIELFNDLGANYG